MPNLRLALRVLFRTLALTASRSCPSLGIAPTTAIFSPTTRCSCGRCRCTTSAGQPGALPAEARVAVLEQRRGQRVHLQLPISCDSRVEDALSGSAGHRQLDTSLSSRPTTAGESMLVSGSYFGVLGLTPAAGRLIGAADDRTPGAHQVAVLSHGFWRTRFATSPAILGSVMVVNAVPMTIIGVAPEGFTGTTLGVEPQVFVPISMRERLVAGFKGLDDRRSYWVYVFARLQPGTTIAQAKAAVDVPYAAIVNDVEAGLQKGMSEATLARFRQAGHGRARSPRPEHITREAGRPDAAVCVPDSCC